MSRKSGINQVPKLLITQEEFNDHPSDVISEINGDFGRWQLRTILLIFLCKIPASWFMACIVFTAPTPKPDNYYCKSYSNSLQIDKNNFNNNNYFNNIINNSINNSMYILHKSDQRNSDRLFHFDACNVYENIPQSKMMNLKSENNSNLISINYSLNVSNMVPCQKFEYFTEFNSLITDFDLVCSRRLLISVTQSFHSFGTLIGGLIARNLLTKLNPKRVMKFGMFAQIICGILTGFVNSFGLHVFFRCITGLCCALMFTAGQSIIVDITSGKAKTIIVTVFELYWSIGLILLPGITIFFDTWTELYVAISAPTIILIFLCRWITDSPRWLLKKGKIEETLAILLESATYNDRKIPLDLENRLELYHSELKAIKAAKYIEIWDGKTKRSQILTVHWAWVWSVTLYNAMILNIRAFGVDHLHSNTVILGFAEMFGILIGLLLILYTRRHWLWSGSLIMGAGFITLFIWLVPSSIKESRRIGADMIFCVCLKLANAVSMAILTTCTSEMVTAKKRPMLMFSVITYSRIWLIIAPFITALSIIHHLIPITVFACLGILTGLFMIFLNMSFWNDNQPKIYQVPSPEMYRKNSQIILSRRESETKNPFENELYQVSIINILNSTTPSPVSCRKNSQVTSRRASEIRNPLENGSVYGSNSYINNLNLSNQDLLKNNTLNVNHYNTLVTKDSENKIS